MDKLRDIHMQSWDLLDNILLIIIFLCVLCLIYRYYWFVQKKSPRRAGLSLLNKIALGSTLDSPQMQSAAVVDILKRVALAYYPRARVASLQGLAWLEFLNTTAQGVNFYRIQDLLLVLPYQHNAGANAADMHLLFAGAKKWIQQQPAVQKT